MACVCSQQRDAASLDESPVIATTIHTNWIHQGPVSLVSFCGDSNTPYLATCGCVGRSLLGARACSWRMSRRQGVACGVWDVVRVCSLKDRMVYVIDLRSAPPRSNYDVKNIGHVGFRTVAYARLPGENVRYSGGTMACLRWVAHV